MANLINEITGRLSVGVFGNKLEVDPRHPIFFFSLPFIGTFGVLGIVFDFWVQLIALSVLHFGLNFVAALISYYFILNKKQSASALLVGFGVVFPLLTLLPFSFIESFDLRNPALKLTAVSQPALHVFRLIETIYGTLPEFAAKGDLRSFLWYFSATVEFNIDPATKKALPATNKEIRIKLLKLAGMFGQCVALYTLFVPFDYNLFPRKTITSVSDIFFWGNLMNNYFMGAMTKSTVEFGTSIFALAVSLFSGMSTCDVNVRPLTMTSSPSDFWGKRWNQLVAKGLKRGIYKPFRKQGFSRPIAALATFAASGILHEYYLAATAFGGRSEDNSYEYHLVGGHLLFFLWNAVVLILEGLLRGNPVIRLLAESLPKPVRTVLVFITVLPICHLFSDQFVSLGLYTGFGLGYPRITPINTTFAFQQWEPSMI